LGLSLGKIRAPDSVWTRPGALDDEEYAIVKRHHRAAMSIEQPFTATA
jgi:response regulator RpfG family c-di-GMP phosphodiesterase